jgi:hypothetical protein
MLRLVDHEPLRPAPRGRSAQTCRATTISISASPRLPAEPDIDQRHRMHVVTASHDGTARV